MRYALILLAFIASPAWGQAKDCGRAPVAIEGRAYVVDGSAIMIVPAGEDRGVEVRLRGIATPGLESMGGAQSRAALDGLLFGMRNEARCDFLSFEGDCRLTGRCGQPYTSSGMPMFKDLSEWMVYGGWAYVDARRAITFPTGPSLMQTERAARDARRGLWRIWLLPESR